MADPLGAFITLTRGRAPCLAAGLAWLRYRGRDAGLRLLDRLVARGDVAVDIGANAGLYTWRLSRLVGRCGHVHAIEPDPALTPLLRRMAAARDNITVHAVALSDRAGAGKLHVPLCDGDRLSELASLTVPPARAGLAHEVIGIRLESLDAILAAGRGPLTLVKCDVEGHEAPVLRGAGAVLRSWRPSVLVEIEQRHQAPGASITETFDYLAGYGYDGYAVADDGLVPLDRFDLARDQLAFLRPTFTPYGMPRGYVHDFLFVQPGPIAGRLCRSR